MRIAPLASRLHGFGTTIFAEMSALAVETGAINLGQGFPDTDGPDAVKEAAIGAIRDGDNQYPPGPGIPELRRAVAAHQQRFYGLEYDPDTEVVVTTGATEAIAAALPELFEPDDDSYAACIAMAGARRRVVTLRAPHYGFDPAALCVERDLIAVTDEVYEHLVFDGEHVPLATFPGMRDRTVTISSGGRTFSFTGWKVGWVCAPPTCVRSAISSSPA